MQRYERHRPRQTGYKSGDRSPRNNLKSDSVLVVVFCIWKAAHVSELRQCVAKSTWTLPGHGASGGSVQARLGGRAYLHTAHWALSDCAAPRPCSSALDHPSGLVVHRVLPCCPAPR